MTTESAPRWVVVTRPDRPGLLDELAWRYRHAPWVMVLADRRHEERRRRQEPCAVNLRVGDRRGLPGAGSQRPAYRLVRQGAGFDVYEAGGHMSTWCPQCGGTVTFDMSAAGDPPAQIDVHAAHNLTPLAPKSERRQASSSGGAIGLHPE